MPIQPFLTTLQRLPNPVKYSTAIYISCAVGYNAVGTYYDSKAYLQKFRSNLLEEHEKRIKTDWDAVKYGANAHFWDRFINSWIWPLTTIKNIIPIIVLEMNPPPKK